MHVLLITYEFPPYMATGGIGSYMYHLAHLMAGKGHQVIVFSATQSHTELTVLNEKEYTNYLIPASNTVVFRSEVLKVFENYIQNHPVDMIESPEVGACALHVKESYPTIPLVVKMHTPGVLITKVSNTYQSIIIKLRYVAGALLRGKWDLGYWSKTDKNRAQDPEYKICMLADQLISPSKALGDYMSCYWQLNKEIKIIPNPFHADADLFQYPLEGREKLICFVGKLTVLKGMFTLTKAVKKILRKYPEYRFVFAGRDEPISEKIPSMREWMEEKLKDVIERVEFTGTLNREQVKDLLRRSRICVVPSLWENYPTVVLEAMAAGAVVAAANKGGIPEIIENRINGLLFNPLKAGSISSSLNSLMINDESRILLARRARDTIKVQSVINHKKIINLYEKTLLTI